MKKYLGAIFAVALACGTASFAAGQDTGQYSNTKQKKASKPKGSSEQVQDTKATTDSGTAKSSADRIFGRVEEYQAGKSIKVSTPGNPEGSRTVDLSGKDITAHVSPNVKAGEWVSISQKKDNNGHTIVRVTRSREAARSKEQ